MKTITTTWALLVVLTTLAVLSALLTAVVDATASVSSSSMTTTVAVESELLLIDVVDETRKYTVTIVGVPPAILESAILRVSVHESSRHRSAPTVTFPSPTAAASSAAATASATAKPTAPVKGKSSVPAEEEDEEDEEDEEEESDEEEDEDDADDSEDDSVHTPPIRDVDNDRDRAAASTKRIDVEPFHLDHAVYPASPAPVSGLQPLLMLVMIVKNEVASLRTTLLSVYGHVDRFCILDTGSSDGTLDLIRAFYAALPDPSHGRLFQEPFVDFSTTRNRLLKLAGQETEFVLMLNGDDRLEGGAALREFLESKRGLTALDEAIYILPVNYGGVSEGRSERVARTANHAVPDWPNDDWNHWRFEGVTHEVYVCNKALHGGERIVYTDGPFSIYHDITSDTQESKRRRFELDVQLLLREVTGHPERANYARSVYYLAQSYYNLQRASDAYKWYSERVKINYPRPTKVGEDNEKARSYLMLADLGPRINIASDVTEKQLKKAYKYCPSAYALFQLAKHYGRTGNAEDALKYAESSVAMARRGSPVVCAGDDQLVLQYAPPLVTHLREGAKGAAKTKEKKKVASGTTKP